MRKIEEKMLEAVRAKKNFTNDNTFVEYDKIKDISSVYLHGNWIYSLHHETGEVFFSFAKWETQTTKSRLRALGIPIVTVQGCSFYKTFSMDRNNYINPLLTYTIKNDKLSLPFYQGE